MPRVLVVQHVACETPGLLGELAAAAGVLLDVRHPYRGDPIPRELGGAAALCVLGGPMGVADAERLPHLRAEMALLAHAVAAGAPVLGICLGSQLLAAAHGARVAASGRQEIGFHAVELTAAAADDPILAAAPRRFAPLHWHGDVFELPAGAVPLASSAMTAHQAFRLGARAWGLLFHLEATPAWVGACATTFADELRGHAIDPAALAAAAPAACAAIHPIGRAVLGAWLALATTNR